MSRRFDRTRQFSPTDRLPYITGTHDEAVQLVGLDVQVHVTGLFAETSQVLRLHNPNARDLEGELVFPLPDGAVVCGYAIDVDGELADGVVVPKQEARRILEAEIRKGVDPGLVEHVQGNIYRSRIYPLPAGGHRTVKLVYISQLTIEDSDAAYHLPLGHAEEVGKVSLRVEVSQTEVEPVALGGLGNLALTSFENRWVAEATLTSGAAAEDLLIRLPNLPDHCAAVERFEEAHYFSISSRTTGPSDETWNPKRVALLWDASGSRQKCARELDLIQALASEWRDITFDVVVLRDVLESESTSFHVKEGVAAELLEFLKGIPSDGGTNLMSVALDAPPHADDEAWLIFTDGLGTVGTGLPTGTSPRAFTITSQPENDGALLQMLATRSGGMFANLTTMEVGAATKRIVSSSGALRLARTAGCEDVHVYSSAGRMTVVGRVTEAIASVYLEGPGAPDDQLSVVRSDATDGRNISRAWAGRQAQLDKLLGASNDKLAELGRRYGLVTPGTSLLVLETLEQHIEYNIEPAATRGKLLSDFLDYRRRGKEDEDQTRQAQLDQVLGLWNQRVAWWEREFKPVLAKEEKQKASRRESRGFSAEEPLASFDEGMDHMEMPAPAPMMRSRAAPRAPQGAIEPESEMAVEELACMDEMEVNGFGAGGGAPIAKKAIGGGTSASVQIQPWSADTPYLTAIRAADQAYKSYLEQRPAYSASPAFFLDCADHLLQLEQRELGLRVLSNLLELGLDDPALFRSYAWRMQQSGELDDAIKIFERVLEMRDDEPQSHRDLALALELRWQRDGDAADAERAMTLLWAVVARSWDRFPEIELIALMELNRLIHFAKEAGIETPADIDPRFVKHLDLDVRISMSWDADLTDVDLHVFEPSGEHAYYGHNLTGLGGLVSRDFTQGYGPEEYVLHRAQAGEYTIKSHYYGSHQQTIAGACTIIVNVFTNFGRADEERQVLTLRLEEASDEVLVGKITINPDQISAAKSDRPAWVSMFRKLKVGMTIDEITMTVGQPDETRGSDTLLLVYHPSDDVEIHVNAGPRLLSVEQVMDGARFDVLKMSSGGGTGVVDRIKKWWAGDD